MSTEELPTLPGVEEQPETKKKKPKAPKVKTEEVTITFPLVRGLHPGGYRNRILEARRLTAEQGDAAHDLLEGLLHAGAKLKDGSPVRNRTHLVKWMLEQIPVYEG